MKRRHLGLLAFVLMVVIGGAFVIMESSEVRASSENTLYVGGSGLGNYTSIQDAIDDASEGDTVFVYSNPYYENIVIKESIILKGEDKNATINGRGEPVVTIENISGGEINGFTITSGGSFGLGLSNVNSFVASSCEICMNHNGLLVKNSTNNRISKCSIYSNGNSGVKLDNSPNNFILFCSIESNDEDGILLTYSNYSTIINSSIELNDDSGIYLSHSNYCTIINSSISHNSWDSFSYNGGIYMHYSGYIEVYGCSISDNGRYGIYLDGICNTIRDCEIFLNDNNGIGSYNIGNCGKNVISYCTIYGNDDDGIFLASPNNTIYGCNLYDNEDAMLSELSGNLHINSPNNTIYNCSIYSKNNKVNGIVIGGSNNNTFYCNNFINNERHVKGPSANSEFNSRTPIKYTYRGSAFKNVVGNYWDEAYGNDLNGDGIIDTTYEINEQGGYDYYPLKKPFRNYFNQPPTCSLSADPTAGYALLDVTFSLSASDSDGSIDSWKLDSDNDGSADYTGSGSPPTTKSHTYQNVGEYVAKFTVTDDDGASDSDTTTITVNETPNQAPTASFDYTPTNPTANTIVNFTDISTDTDGNIENCTWEFGDGTTEYGQTTNHIYTAPGTYNVTLTVKDDDGATDTYITSVVIKAPSKDEDGTPGFGLALLVTAIAAILLIKCRKRKR